MDRSPKQLQELTLALLYLTSLQDHDDPAGRRCWKGYDFQVLEDLKAQGLLQDTQGRIPLRLPPGGRGPGPGCPGRPGDGRPGPPARITKTDPPAAAVRGGRVGFYRETARCSPLLYR